MRLWSFKSPRLLREIRGQAVKLNEWIDAQLEIEAKATKGEWKVEFERGEYSDEVWGVSSPEEAIIKTDTGVYPPYANDASLICSARNNYRPLLLALKEATKALNESCGCCLPLATLRKIEALLLAQQQGEK